MTTDRDPQVGALLDRLPVDPPAPGFWDDLRARIESGDVVQLHPVPSAARSRRRRVVVAAVAAAAVVVAVVVGSALRDGRDDLDTGPPITQPTDPPPVVPATPEDAVRTAVTRWILNVTEGSTDGAWAVLGPQSRESIGGRAAFEELMATSLPDAWAPWRDGFSFASFNLGSAAEPRWWIVQLDHVAAGDDETVVLAVRVGADLEDVTVEPFIPGPAIGLIGSPGPERGGRPGSTPNGPFEVRVDAEVLHFVVAIDGVRASDDQLVRDSSGAVTGVHPTSPLSTETSHVLAVGVLLADGTLAADARVFTVH